MTIIYYHLTEGWLPVRFVCPCTGVCVPIAKFTIPNDINHDFSAGAELALETPSSVKSWSQVMLGKQGEELVLSESCLFCG